MKTLKLFALLIVATLLLKSTPISAAATYTFEEVHTHDTPSDCWMTFEEKVYDLSDYVNSHDIYMDITDWCGKDMTQDFQTKAGLDRDHKSSTYAMLDNYYLGDLTPENTSSAQNQTNDTTVSISNKESTSTSDSKTGSDTTANTHNPYNFWLPFVTTTILYLAHWYISSKQIGKKIKLLSRIGFNMVWNSVLFVSLIPSAVFGIYLIARYSYPSLYNIKFDFLYWHVEGSVVFATLCLLHFITRLKVYLGQIKGSLKNK